MAVLYHTALAIASTVCKNKLSENRIVPELGDKKLQHNIRNELLKITKKQN